MLANWAAPTEFAHWLNTSMLTYLRPMTEFAYWLLSIVYAQRATLTLLTYWPNMIVLTYLGSQAGLACILYPSMWTNCATFAQSATIFSSTMRTYALSTTVNALMLHLSMFTFFVHSGRLGLRLLCVGGRSFSWDLPLRGHGRDFVIYRQ